MPIGRIGRDFIANTEFFGRQGAPSSTTLADGRFVVTWTSFDGGDGSSLLVRGRVFNADGTATENDFILNSTADGAQEATAVAALADGRFVVTWSSNDAGDGSNNCIRARLFDADGSPVDLDLVANSTGAETQSAPAVTGLADGRFVVMWQSADTADGALGCIRARIFNADGMAAGTDFVVNTTAEGLQVGPTLTTLAGGGFVATWASNDAGDGSGACVRGRIFTAVGSPVGSDFIVNTTTTSSQYLSVIAALPNGGFVAAWYSEDPGDGSSGCVRARLFNASGVASAQDFIVNTVATNAQVDPSVAALPDGRFVIVWSSGDTGDGSGSCIRARLFNPDGSAAGADFIVNTSTANAQAVPSVTAFADGRFVVSWESDDGGEGGSAQLGSSIRAQIFDATKFVGTVGEDVWSGSDLFADTINGGGSADWLAGLGGDDLISGDAGTDTLFGGAGIDRLYGGADGDALDGGSGADTMAGGAGDDSYVVDNAGDVVIETAGQGALDTVRASVSYALAASAQVELLTTASAAGTTAQNLTGSDAAQNIQGNAGTNVIDGKGGADLMQGFAGSDNYRVDNAGDVVDESVAGSNGTDTVLSSAISVDLNNATAFRGAIEQIILDGALAINAIGNGLSNALVGNSAANQLDGRGGVDVMRGLGGNDLYSVDNLGDIVDEAFAGSGGLDTVRTTSIAVDFSNTVRFKGDLEQIVLEGGAALNATGNGLGNAIVGNSGANVITGGLGLDRQLGNGGADTFVFRDAPDSVVGVNRDVILDFEDVGDNDTIDLSGFAGVLTFIGGAAFTAANQVRAITSGADVLIEINTAGPGGAESQILLANTAIGVVDATDFIV